MYTLRGLVISGRDLLNHTRAATLNDICIQCRNTTKLRRVVNVVVLGNRTMQERNDRRRIDGIGVWRVR